LTELTRLQQILAEYAERGVFRGFSAHPEEPSFRLLWHRNQFFDLVFDEKTKTLRIPLVMPSVNQEMYAHYKEFVRERFSHEVPEHRRIDRKKARARTSLKGGKVGLTMIAADGDLDYTLRKLIHLVHETYLVFLYDSRYYTYLIETFDLDPDSLAG
jgi:hypothetical protein